MDKDKLDNVIEGLERCIRDSEHINDNPCFKCPYSCQCQEGYTSAIKEDALELLKKQKNEINELRSIVEYWEAKALQK